MAVKFVLKHHEANYISFWAYAIPIAIFNDFMVFSVAIKSGWNTHVHSIIGFLYAFRILVDLKL